jgi:hypothetical protein
MASSSGVKLLFTMCFPVPRHLILARGERIIPTDAAPLPFSC